MAAPISAAPAASESTILEELDSLVHQIEKRVRSASREALYHYDNAYHSLPPIYANRVSYREIPIDRLRGEVYSLLRSVEGYFKGHEADLDMLRSDLNLDADRCAGRRVYSEGGVSHSLREYRGRFATPEGRLLNYRAFKVESVVQPVLSTLVQYADRSGGRYEVTHRPLPFQTFVLGNGETWIRVPGGGKGVFKQVDLWEEVSTGERLARAKPNLDLSLRSRKFSEKLFEIEHQVYRISAGVLGIAQLPQQRLERDKLSLSGMVMEGYDCALDSLLEKRSSLLSDDRFQLKVAWQLLHGLAFLHKRGIAHLDLKPANILLRHLDGNRPEAAIADMGCAEIHPKEKVLLEERGTPYYMAPEMAGFSLDSPEVRERRRQVGSGGAKGDLVARFYLECRDCWAIGLVLYQLTHGGVFPTWHPTDARSMAELQRRLKQANPQPSARGGEDSLQKVITDLLVGDPLNRSSAAEAFYRVEQLLYPPPPPREEPKRVRPTPRERREPQPVRPTPRAEAKPAPRPAPRPPEDPSPSNPSPRVEGRPTPRGRPESAGGRRHYPQHNQSSIIF